MTQGHLSKRFATAINKPKILYERGIVTQSEYFGMFEDAIDDFVFRFRDDPDSVRQFWQQTCQSIVDCPDGLSEKHSDLIYWRAISQMFSTGHLKYFYCYSVCRSREPDRQLPRNATPHRDSILSAIEEFRGPNERGDLERLIDTWAVAQIPPFAQTQTELLRESLTDASERVRKLSSRLLATLLPVSASFVMELLPIDDGAASQAVRQLQEECPDELHHIDVAALDSGSYSIREVIERWTSTESHVQSLCQRLSNTRYPEILIDVHDVLAIYKAGILRESIDASIGIASAIRSKIDQGSFKAKMIACAFPPEIRRQVGLGDFTDDVFLKELASAAPKPIHVSSYCLLKQILKRQTISLEQVEDLAESVQPDVRCIGLWLASQVPVSREFAIRLVRRATHDMRHDVRVAGLQLLNDIGPVPEDQPLIEWLILDHDPTIRSWAAWLASRAGIPELVDNLLHLFSDKFLEVRCVAWWAATQLPLGTVFEQYGNNPFQTQLERALTADRPPVVLNAICFAKRFRKQCPIDKALVAPHIASMSTSVRKAAAEFEC